MSTGLAARRPRGRRRPARRARTRSSRRRCRQPGTGRGLVAGQLGGRPGERQPGLLLAAEHLRARSPSMSRTPGDELAGVGRVPGGAGRHHPHGADARRAVDDRGVAARAPRSVRASASGASRPVASTPWPEPDDLHPAVHVGQRASGRVRRRRPAAAASSSRSRSPPRGRLAPSVTRPPSRATHGPPCPPGGPPAPTRLRGPAGWRPARRARGRPGRAGT